MGALQGPLATTTSLTPQAGCVCIDRSGAPQWCRFLSRCTLEQSLPRKLEETNSNPLRSILACTLP